MKYLGKYPRVTSITSKNFKRTISRNDNLMIVKKAKVSQKVSLTIKFHFNKKMLKRNQKEFHPVFYVQSKKDCPLDSFATKAIKNKDYNRLVIKIKEYVEMFRTLKHLFMVIERLRMEVKSKTHIFFRVGVNSARCRVVTRAKLSIIR